MIKISLRTIFILQRKYVRKLFCLIFYIFTFIEKIKTRLLLVILTYDNNSMTYPRVPIVQKFLYFSLFLEPCLYYNFYTL